ncbi:MAG: 5'/3'-nucleotidase SurE [Gammaproteobacteria bacterium]
MRFLVSNDDGYQALGIRVLAESLRALGQVVVVAPDRNRSGASNSLTLDAPLHVQTADNGFHFINGTPTDSVHLALTGMLDFEPDMVVAGINAGANLGDDVLYSGTVAAAMEGRFLGLPAIAVSLVGEHLTHYATAARVIERLIRTMQYHPLPADTILNVNVPDMPWEQLQGFEATRLGHRHKAEPAVRTQDPRGRTIYWVGAAGPEEDAGPGTDFHALRRNCVSITPLQVDLTRYTALDTVAKWLQDVTHRNE